MSVKDKPLKSLASALLLSVLSGCAVHIPNTKFCAVAGVMEAGMDCFYTLSEDEERIPAAEIKYFLESMPDLKDASGKVIKKGHGAAICQSSEDWGREHAALDLACQKLGASCTYEIRKMIDDVNRKVENLQKGSNAL